MAKIVHVENSAPPGMDGWSRIYRVRRSDGLVVTALCSATRTKEAVMRTTGDEEARAFIADKGESAAIRGAKRIESPSGRGDAFIGITLDRYGGGLHITSYYEPQRVSLIVR